MKWSQLLNYINNYFDKLSTFQKVEMYLIPIISIALLIYNLPKLQDKTVHKEKVVENKNFYSIKKEQLLQKIKSVHTIKTAKDIEEYAKKIHLEISSLKVSKNELLLEVEGNLQELLLLINFCENYKSFTKIENLIINKSQNEIKTFLTLSFAKIIRTKSDNGIENDIYNIKNPFLGNVTSPHPKLYAIVNDHVLINNKWLKKGDTFDGYEVLKIDIDFVQLKSDTNVFKIGLFEEK